MYQHTCSTEVRCAADRYYALAFTPPFDAFMFERSQIGRLQELEVDREREGWDVRHFRVYPQSHLVSVLNCAFWALGIEGEVQYESYQYRSQTGRRVEFTMETSLVEWLHVKGSVEVREVDEEHCVQDVDIMVFLDRETSFSFLVPLILRNVVAPELERMAEGVEAWRREGRAL